jgi:hypothetical protein
MGYILNFNSRVVELLSKNQTNIRILAIILLIMMVGTKIASNINPIYTPMGTLGGFIFGMNLTYHIFQ